MTGLADRLLFLTALTLGSLPYASASAHSHQSGLLQVSLRSLWDSHANQDSTEINSAGAMRRKRSHSARQLEPGSLVRTEVEDLPAAVLLNAEADQRGARSGMVARRFILRDGLKPAEDATFDGTSALHARLYELKGRCSGAFGQGWALIDTAQDTRGGHHWVLQGPSPLEKGQVLLHVSSRMERSAGGLSPLIVSPAKLCHELPAVLLEDSQANNPKVVVMSGGASSGTASSSDAQPDNVLVDEPEMMQLTNENAVNAMSIIRERVLNVTAKKCDGDGQVASVDAIAARGEVAGGINVMITAKLTPKKAGMAITYHVFTVDFAVCGDCPSGFLPALVLPYDHAEKADVAWCDLTAKSTEENLAGLVETHGPGAPEKWIRKLGLLNVFRDHRPEHDIMLEKQAAAKRKAADCIADSAIPDTFDPRTLKPECAGKASVEDQGSCASCWAFAATTSLAIRQCIKDTASMGTPAGGRKMFSKQQLLSCNEQQSGCQGGYFAEAFEESRKGIALEDDYPYYPGHAAEFPWSGYGKRCMWGEVQKPFIVTAHYPLQGQGVTKIQKDLYCKGPITAGFLLRSNFFNFYLTNPKAVYTKADLTGATNVGGHAVVLVGWGLTDAPDADTPGTNYWTLLNSWGDSWADDGFFKMERGVDLCMLETMTMHAGDVEQTTGSWMYKDWSTCDDTDKKSRGIKCMGSDGVSEQEAEVCPNADGAYWPNPTTFPMTSSKKYQEIEAFRSCTETKDTCNTFEACNGAGKAVMVNGKCSCLCYKNYAGYNCERCSDSAEGFPRCREKCPRIYCNRFGKASGVRWETEFGDKRDSCDCACFEGYTGDTCTECTDAGKTWPVCRNYTTTHPLAYLTTSGMPTTTTTTPCHIYRGPIELLPPKNKSWIVIDCDVRKPDCTPDAEKCTSATYAKFCEWKVSTAEHVTGQCGPKNSTNSSHYHVRVPGTERVPEHFGNGTDVVRENVTIR